MISRDDIVFHDGTLWGISGGQLEYVSQRVETKYKGTKWETRMVITFKDHDVADTGDTNIYKISFPINQE